MSIKRSLLCMFLVTALVLSPCYGDTIAPRPNSMRWRVVPTTLGPTTITMAVPTALDAAGDYPCEYSFECTNIPAANSGWISDANYTATNLDPCTTYSFRARARDSGGYATGWSFTIPATTDA